LLAASPKIFGLGPRGRKRSRSWFLRGQPFGVVETNAVVLRGR
jgi:hypothetical protein